MNSFSNWKSGSALQNAFQTAEAPQTTNYGSLEAFAKSILGEEFGKAEVEKPTVSENDLASAKQRVTDLAAHADRIGELTNALEKKIEEASAEPEIFEEVEQATPAYRIFRDRDENFECKISIQGAGLAAAQARIILDCNLWNFTFYGKLSKDGKCLIPIKKGIPLPEGSRGRARLEVIVDEQLFIPWEDDFVVEGSKKVKAEVKGQTSIKVSFDSLSDNEK